MVTSIIHQTIAYHSDQCSAVMTAEARHKSPASLSKLSARRMRQTIIESVQRIKGKTDSWVPRYFPCREPLSVSRHAIKTLHEYLLSAPHLYQVKSIFNLKYFS